MILSIWKILFQDNDKVSAKQVYWPLYTAPAGCEEISDIHWMCNADCNSMCDRIIGLHQEYAIRLHGKLNPIFE